MKILFTFPARAASAPACWRRSPIAKQSSPEARAVLGNEVATLDSADALQHTRAGPALSADRRGSAGRASYSVRAWIRRWSAACPSARFRPR